MIAFSVISVRALLLVGHVSTTSSFAELQSSFCILCLFWNPCTSMYKHKLGNPLSLKEMENVAKERGKEGGTTIFMEWRWRKKQLASIKEKGENRNKIKSNYRRSSGED